MTARRLQSELGGEIVFFCHDADHDPRETMTILRDRRSGQDQRINFSFANKLQREFSPLFAKRTTIAQPRAAELRRCIQGCAG